MKKIGLLTFTDSYNHGAGLQTYATCEVLKREQYEVELINYRNIEEEKVYKILGYIKNAGFLPNLKKLVKNGIFGGVRNGMKGFKEFNNMIPRTQRYDLKNIRDFDRYEDHDIVVIGSDQVWNPVICGKIFDWTFFGNFTEKKLVSFASSCGSYSFSEEDQKTINPLLNRFSNISVREEFLKKQLEQYHIQCPIQKIIDPTLQLSKSDWSWLLDRHARVTLPDESYLVVYLTILKYEKCWELIEYIAFYFKLKIVFINRFNIKKSKVAYYYRDISPFDFVKLIAHATFVFTDSFHGTAFSVLYERLFVTVNNGNPKRIEDLLCQIHAGDRMVSTKEELENICKKEIDFGYVKKVLEQERNKARRYICEAFQ